MQTLLMDTALVGSAVGLVALLLPIRRLEPIIPVLVLVAAGIAFWRGVLAPTWALSSLGMDAPWGLALLWGLWAAQARAGWLRAGGWGGAVIGGAIVGDLTTATALVAGEPDPARRARLVLAASGASMIGVGGAAALILGWGGPRAVLLGVVLALVGFAPGPMFLSAKHPERGQVGLALAASASAALCVAILVWLAAASHLLEFAALQVEPLPNRFPGWVRPLAMLPAVALGALTDEGAGAIAAQAILDRAFNLQGDWARQMSVVGLSVGGGLPLLVLTRSSLRVGLPLWLAQVAVAAAWVAFGWVAI